MLECVSAKGKKHGASCLFCRAEEAAAERAETAKAEAAAMPVLIANFLLLQAKLYRCYWLDFVRGLAVAGLFALPLFCLQ